MSVYGTYRLNADPNINPVDYTQLQYLESIIMPTYFDTGFVPNQDTSIKCKLQILSITNNEFYTFGSGVDYTTRTFECYAWDGRLQFNYGGSFTFTDDYIHVNDTLEIDWNKNVVKYRINEGEWKTINFTYRTFTTPYTLYVLTLHRPSGSPQNSAKCKFYYCEIYDNGELIRNYKPVQDNNGTLGVFDTINKTAPEILGVNSFTPGPDDGISGITPPMIVNASKDITQLDYDLAECEEGWHRKYTRVNYLSDYKDNIVNVSTIMTDISHNQIGYYDITFQYNEASFNCVIGSNNGAGNKYICWYSNQLHEGNGGNVIDTGNDRIIGHQYRFICKKGTNQSVAYRDGEFLKNFTSSMWDPTTNKLHLLGMPGYSGGKNFIYQCEFRTSEDGEVLGKFIPCIRNSDSHAGMYDMVTKQFYEPLSGSFYPGPIESHFDYRKFHMYCARPIYQIDIDIADKVDGWFGEYLRTDYIQSNSGAYINTGVLPTPKNFKIEVKGIQIQSRSLFGTNGGGINMIHFTGNDASFARYCYLDAIGRFAYMSGVHTFTLDTGKFYVDGELKTPIQDFDTIPEGTGTIPMFLFSRNQNGSSEDGGDHTIYSAKIWNNGELVRDYIPCIRRSDMKAGLYDLVGKQFYISPNNRDFIPGGNQYEFNFIKY